MEQILWSVVGAMLFWVLVVGVRYGPKTNKEDKPVEELAVKAVEEVIPKPEPVVPKDETYTSNYRMWRVYKVCVCGYRVPTFSWDESEKMGLESLSRDKICAACAEPSDKMVEKIGREYTKTTIKYRLYDKSWYSHGEGIKYKKELTSDSSNEYFMEYKGEEPHEL